MVNSEYIDALRELHEVLEVFLDTGYRSGVGDETERPPDRRLVSEGGEVHNAVKAVESHCKTGKLPAPHARTPWGLICDARDSESDERKWQTIAHHNADLLLDWAEQEIAKHEPPSNDLPRDELPSDPITLKQLAKLSQIKYSTFRNWGKAGRPNPAIASSGQQPAVFSYAKLRKWLIERRPDSEPWLPLDYDTVRTALSKMSS